MTDKEQIMINGIDVGECKFFNNITENHYCFGIPCKDRPNCYFKQLARKTQECEIWKNQVLILNEEDVTVQVTQEQFEEYQQLKQACEELKAYAQQQENQRETYYKEFLKKDKALEVIEGIIKSSTKDFNHIDWEAKASHALTAVDKISDIINKAKGE